MTAAITKLLQHGDPDAVGVFAQLAYVDSPRLSEVLAANYCSAMQVRCMSELQLSWSRALVALCFCGAWCCVTAVGHEPIQCGWA
jgi:hypothetical protein